MSGHFKITVSRFRGPTGERMAMGRIYSEAPALAFTFAAEKYVSDEVNIRLAVAELKVKMIEEISRAEFKLEEEK